MPITEEQVSELKHAYQVLDVPLCASASLIKQTYRKFVKRWHPDRYPSGTEAYAEATQMTKTINAAYSVIENAPLRYHVEACPPSYITNRQNTHRSQSRPFNEAPPKVNWLEFWIRFVCGAVLGIFVSIRFFLFPLFAPYYNQPKTVLLGTMAIMLICGLASAQTGDDFWHSIFRHWWTWS